MLNISENNQPPFKRFFQWGAWKSFAGKDHSTAGVTDAKMDRRQDVRE